MKFLIFSAIIVLAAVTKRCEPTIDQGLAGEVRWLEGNLMPTIGEEPETDDEKRKGEPVQRELHIYELTTMDEATAEGTFFYDIQSPLVKTVESDKDGYFQVELPAGRYSVFVQEEEGLFANIFDGEGNINPVEIKNDEVTKITIEINYKAAY